jgi:hypothetical protein
MHQDAFLDNLRDYPDYELRVSIVAILFDPFFYSDSTWVHTHAVF